MKNIAVLFTCLAIAMVSMAQNSVTVRNALNERVCVVVYGNTVCSATGATVSQRSTIAPGSSVTFPSTATHPFQGAVVVYNQGCLLNCTPATSIRVGIWANSLTGNITMCNTGYNATATWSGNPHCGNAHVLIN